MSIDTENLDRYAGIYSEFTSSLSKGTCGPEDVALKIQELGREKVRLTLFTIEARRMFRERKAEIVSGIDPDTGKPITGTKSETLADATPEAAALDLLETHESNCKDAIYYLHDLKDAIRMEFDLRTTS